VTRRNPTDRQWYVFTAQVIGVPVGVAIAVYLLPSWWGVLPVPAFLVIPALIGAAMDTRDERREAKVFERELSIKVHPSNFDAYFEIPEREWSE